MIALIVLSVLAGWFLIALALALFIGRAVKIADKRRVRPAASTQ
jgi:hypothetical protein